MGTTLTGTKPKDTYDSLIKVGDNGPISGTAKYLSDGLGNNLPIAVSTSNVGIGTSSPSGTGWNTSAKILHINQNDSDGALLRLQSSSTSLVLQSGNNASYIVNITDSPLILGTNSLERVRVTNNGLTFNGDTAVANALNDYETGTWTMGVSFGGASVGVTTSNNTGTYTKIGRQVTVNGYISLTSKGSSTGSARITGLPFTTASGSSFYSAASLQLGSTSFANQYSGISQVGTTNVELYESTEAGVISNLTNADFANNSDAVISLTYFV